MTRPAPQARPPSRRRSGGEAARAEPVRPGHRRRRRGRNTTPEKKETAPATKPAASPPAVQARLSGLDPQDRLASSKTEEDLLDIPAFLRRQAN